MTMPVGHKASGGIFPSGFFLVLFFAAARLQGQELSVHIHVQSANNAAAADSIAAHRGETILRSAGTDSAGLIRSFADIGFLEARIDSSAVSASVREFWVSEGPPAILRSLEVRPASSQNPTPLHESGHGLVGTRLRASKIEEWTRTLLVQLEGQGYPYAVIQLESVRKQRMDDTEFVDLEYSVLTGPPGIVTEIRVEGNTSTKSAVILREARMPFGERFTDQSADRIRKRLLRSQLFSTVQTPEVYDAGTPGLGLLIRITEGSPNSFDAIAGYVPAPIPGRSGYLTGLLNVQFGNILGTGRKLAARWYRENESSQEVELRYTEPWLGGWPVNARGSLFQRKQDSSFVQQRLDVAAEYLFTDEVSVGVTYAQANVFPTAGFGLSVIPESKITSFGIQLRYDSRDNVINPREGTLYATDYARGSKSSSGPFPIPSSREIATERYTFDVEAYVPVIRNQVLALELHGRSASAPTLDISDLSLLGGATTVRGYREGQFRGNKLAWTNLEYRFLTGGVSSVFAFVDAAYVAVQASHLIGTTGTESHPVGYGVGARTDSPLGVLGVSIAFGQGDSFGDGKLHVRLHNRF